MRAYYRIVNWDQHQHYKHRNPPWIKLYGGMLSSETWVMATDADKLLMVASMLLACRTGNQIPASPAYIQRTAQLDAVPDMSNLLAAQFIELVEEMDDASSVLARRGQDALPETEGETEGEAPAKVVAQGRGVRSTRARKPK